MSSSVAKRQKKTKPEVLDAIEESKFKNIGFIRLRKFNKYSSTIVPAEK